MKLTIKIFLILSIIATMIAGYWTLARYTNIINDSFLKKGKWTYEEPVYTLIVGFITSFILAITLKYYKSVIEIVNPRKSLKVGLGISLFFVLFASMCWYDSWINKDVDARELGDFLWKLGHPLTFYIIDFPIYLRFYFEQLQKYWSDFWAFPSVLILFVIQFTIYVHGFRMIINLKKIRATCNTVLSDNQNENHN